VGEECSERRQFWAARPSGKARRRPSVFAEPLNSRDPPARLRSLAAKCNSSMGREVHNENCA
jgi:hypothetical protein